MGRSRVAISQCRLLIWHQENCIATLRLLRISDNWERRPVCRSSDEPGRRCDEQQEKHKPQRYSNGNILFNAERGSKGHGLGGKPQNTSWHVPQVRLHWPGQVPARRINYPFARCLPIHQVAARYSYRPIPNAQSIPGPEASHAKRRHDHKRQQRRNGGNHQSTFAGGSSHDLLYSFGLAGL